MSILVASLQGRFGNQVMQYLFARAIAEQYEMELRIEPWIGDWIFCIHHDRPTDGDNAAKRFNELDIFAAAKMSQREDPDDYYRIAFRGYAQSQRCMIYTKRQAQSWLKLRPEIEDKLAALRPVSDKIICHRRAGDYAGYGYPVVSWGSYYAAMAEFGRSPAYSVRLL